MGILTLSVIRISRVTKKHDSPYKDMRAFDPGLRVMNLAGLCEVDQGNPISGRWELKMNDLHERLSRAKAAFTTRRVVLEETAVLLHEGIVPRPGDLVLARVEEIGQHHRLELTDGRRAHLFVGDEILVCYGNRYAQDQYEAIIPENLSSCHLVAAGGVAAKVLSKHENMKKPTKLKPIGILGGSFGRPLNLARFALKKTHRQFRQPLTLAVLGTAMNSGTTTTAAWLIKGLTASGLKVGAAKATGTGAGGDLWFMKDAGADPVLDFVDAGFVSTYLISNEQVLDVWSLLISHLTNAGVDAIVIEIADGLYQRETSALISSPNFRTTLDGVIFAARDAMGCKAGVDWLLEIGLPVLGLSGVFTKSPLAVREVKETVGLPVLNKKILCDSEVAVILESQMAIHRRKSVLLRVV